MDIGVMVYVCGVILALTLVLDPFLRVLSYGRAEIAMLCVCVVVLSMLRVNITPEVIIDPGSIALLILLTCSVVKRREFNALRFFTCIALITPLTLLAALYTGSDPYITAAVSVIGLCVCSVSRPALSMLSAAAAFFAAYYASAAISTCLPGGVYGVFEAEDMFRVQALGMALLFLLHGSCAWIRAWAKRRTA